MLVRRELWAVLAVALIIGLGAYLYYFQWDEPLLTAEDITRYAVGYEGQNIRDFEVFEDPAGGPSVERLVGLVNDATLVNEDVELTDGSLLVILFRDDGLQYHLFPGGDDLTGISEGDRSYVGTLRSAELRATLEELGALVPPESTS